MNLRKILACLVMASLLSAILPGAVFADTSPQKIFAQALGIRAPQIIEVNQTFNLQTIEKHSQKAEPGVAVYAVKATELNRSLSDNSTASATAIMNKYADVAKNIGILLGTTGAGGQLSCSLADSQQYVLIAVKDGFIPGFTRINVVLALKKNLQLNAPGVAEAGKQIVITVTERPVLRPVATIQRSIVQNQGNEPMKAAAAQILPVRQIPVADASVYAIKATLAEGIVAQAYNKTTEATDKYAALVKEKGFFIGTTDAKGQLYYTFNDVDHYILIAIKNSYTPGFARINIVLAGQKALRLEAPNIAEVGKTVTMTVTERGFVPTVTPSTAQAPTPSSSAQPMSIARLSPVSGANIYAVKVQDIDPISDILKQANGDEKAAADKYMALAKGKGILLGATNEKGQLDYAYKETGKYVLIAVKDGYRADFARIGIVLAERKALRLNAVESALIGQQVTIAVTEKVRILPFPYPQEAPKTIIDAQPNPGQTTATQKIMVQPVNREVPVAGANIYAFPLKNSDVVPEALLSADGGINTAGEKYLELAKNWFIGTTNADGKLITKFGDAGLYLIIAVKDGFTPDFEKIRIIQPNLQNNQFNLQDKSK